MKIPPEIHRNLIVIASTCICFILFGIYGWFEFTDRAEALLRFAKEWTGIGAEYTAETVKKFDSESKRITAAYEYRKIDRDEIQARFALQMSARIDDDTVLWMPEYLDRSTLFPLVLNEIERRYTNERYKALITDITGYVPTGSDRRTGAKSVRNFYTGDRTKDEKNWSFRFFPYHAKMDRLINSVFDAGDGIGYVASQIVVDDRVWGYFIISFDMHIIKTARFEIVRRIFLICLIFGCLLSVIVEGLPHKKQE